MPSLFETARAAPPLPITIRQQGERWEGESATSFPRGAAIRPGQRLCRKARQVPDAAGGGWRDAQVLFGLEDGEQPIARPRSGPAPCRACCHRASIVSPMRRMTQDWRRLPLRSAAIASAAIAKTDGRLIVRLVPARRHRCRRRRADDRRAAFLARRSHQHASSNDYGAGGTGAGPRKRYATRVRRQLHLPTIREELTGQNFPLIPRRRHGLDPRPALDRLIFLGDPSHPKVTLVGKGVWLRHGGLDLKPSSGMLIMKKDMGGAANVLRWPTMVMGCEAETAPLMGPDPRRVENAVAATPSAHSISSSRARE